MSWPSVIEYYSSEPAERITDFRVDTRLAREAINVGRAAEITALTCDDALDGFRSDELLDGGGSACMDDAPQKVQKLLLVTDSLFFFQPFRPG